MSRALEAAGSPREEAPDETRSRTPLWLHVLFALLLLGTGAYLYASVTRVEETDELKYLHLSEKLDLSPSSYTLRGTALIKLRIVALDVNDVPLFYHPPMVPALLKAIRWIAPDDERQLVLYPLRRPAKYALLPIAAHLLTVLLLWGYWGRGQRPMERGLPALLLLLSPIAGTIATQVWLDTVLTFFFVAAVSAYHRALHRGTHLSFLLAGLLIGCALLTKFTAVLLLPVLGVAHLVALGCGRRSLARLGTAAAGAALVCGPWFAHFFHTYGSFFPTWIKPSQEMMDRSLFVNMIVHRPPSFYLQMLLLQMPVLALVLLAPLRRFRRRETWLALGLALLLIAAFTGAGLTRSGYQTRHVLPALPFLCLLATWVLVRLPRWALALALVSVVWGAYNLHRNLYAENAAGQAEVRLFFPWSEEPEGLLPDPEALRREAFLIPWRDGALEDLDPRPARARGLLAG